MIIFLKINFNLYFNWFVKGYKQRWVPLDIEPKNDRRKMSKNGPERGRYERREDNYNRSNDSRGYDKRMSTRSPSDGASGNLFIFLIYGNLV